MLIVGQIFDGCQNTVQSQLLKKYRVQPLQQVGLEGFWGLIVTTLSLLAIQHIPCDSVQLCPDGSIDNLSKAWIEYGENHYLIVLSIIAILTSMLYNGFCVFVTKHASATQSCTIDISRTSLIWLFFLMIPFNGATERFYGLQLVGFTLITVGTLFYNEIVKIPGFNYQKVYLFRSMNKSMDVSTIMYSRMRHSPTDDHLPKSLQEPLLGKNSESKH